MLEFLQARITLAKSRVLQTIEPEESAELKLISHETAHSIGFNNPELQPGALATDEPDIMSSFHEGVGNDSYWRNQIDLDYKEVDYL